MEPQSLAVKGTEGEGERSQNWTIIQLQLQAPVVEI